jgi:phenol/toluene 2-monooxygenase (NADH) P4/A4
VGVRAAYEDYSGTVSDAAENFRGNQVVYLGWDRHLMFATPVALPLSPAMPFTALVEQVLPGADGLHPEFARIDWNDVQWQLDGRAFEPARDASLADNGIGHKSVLRFVTPGLHGIGGVGF